jgi:hypothetical protein
MSPDSRRKTGGSGSVISKKRPPSPSSSNDQHSRKRHTEISTASSTGSVSGDQKKESAGSSSHQHRHKRHTGGSTASSTGSIKKTQEVPLRPKAGPPSSQQSKATTPCRGHPSPPKSDRIDDQLKEAFERCGPCQEVLNLRHRGACFKDKHRLLQDAILINKSIRDADYLLKIGTKCPDLDSLLVEVLDLNNDVDMAEYLVQKGAKFDDLDGLIKEEFKKELYVIKNPKTPTRYSMSRKTRFLVSNLDKEGQTRCLEMVLFHLTFGSVPAFVDFLMGKPNGATLSSCDVEKVARKRFDFHGYLGAAFNSFMSRVPKDLLHDIVKECRNSIEVPLIDEKDEDEHRSKNGIFRPKFSTKRYHIPKTSIKAFMDHFKDTFEITASDGQRVKFNEELMKLRSPFFERHLKYTGEGSLMKGDPKHKFEETGVVLKFIKKYAEESPSHFDWKRSSSLMSSLWTK